ncbi:MAG: DJ-1/PfpI family protein [Actinomycetota bacterium]
MSSDQRLRSDVAQRVRSTAGRLRASVDRRRPAGQPPGELEPLVGWSHGHRRESISPGDRTEPVPTVAVVVYQGVSSTEAEVVADALAVALGARVRLVALEAGPYAAVEPARTVIAEAFDDVPEPYGLVIPGGLGWRREAQRPDVLRWLLQATDTARGTIAVSTGSLLLAATGTLAGRETASHWLAGDLLAELGARPSTRRVVHGRLLVTASGARAGAEAARRLAKEMRFSF